VRVIALTTGTYTAALKTYVLRAGREYELPVGLGERLIREGLAGQTEEKGLGNTPENKNLGNAPENK
jgi:hypothetical protein